MYWKQWPRLSRRRHRCDRRENGVTLWKLPKTLHHRWPARFSNGIRDRGTMETSSRMRRMSFTRPKRMAGFQIIIQIDRYERIE